MTGTMLDACVLRRAAAQVLRHDTTGTHPPRRGWDAGFVAMGLARIDVPGAVTVLRGLDGSGPPVHAIALRHVLDRGRENGGCDQAVAEGFAARAFDEWLARHRLLACVRDPDGVGLVEIHHRLESGFDDSPRWDRPLAPTRAGAAGFRVRDVFFSAVLAAASEVLAGIGDELGRPGDAAELRGIASRFRAGVASTVDPRTGLARDFDVPAREWIAPLTVAGFAPLVAGGDPELLARQHDLLLGEHWMGHAVLRHPLPPSTSPSSPAFRRRACWRGPVWPFLTLLLGWAAQRDGALDLRAVLRDASLEQLGGLELAEYYEPITGEPLGGHGHARTAAAALEWLAGR